MKRTSLIVLKKLKSYQHEYSNPWFRLILFFSRKEISKRRKSSEENYSLGYCLLETEFRDAHFFRVEFLGGRNFPEGNFPRRVFFTRANVPGYEFNLSYVKNILQKNVRRF